MQHPYKRTRYALEDQPPIAQCEPQNNWQFGQTSNKTDVNQQRNIVRQRHNCRQIGGMTMRRNGELKRIVGSPRALSGRRGAPRPRTAIARFARYARSSLRFILKWSARNERRGSHTPLRPLRTRGERERDSFNGGLDESFHCKSAYSRGRALLSSFCRTALIATIEVRSRTSPQR